METTFSFEQYWIEAQPTLKELGYILRDRYQPDWTPSWGLGFSSLHEDSQYREAKYHLKYMDATRESDNAFVMLKKISLKEQKQELDINKMVNMKPLSSELDNHCIRLHEVKILKQTDAVDPDERTVILVTPLLLPYNQFWFDTVGEVVDFCQQIFEGLAFLHRHGIAHRDCTGNNIMMHAAANYPEPWHPINPKMKRDWSGKTSHSTRTRGPPRYFFTNFHLSRKYDPKTIHLDEKDDSEPLEDVAKGADTTAPEYANAKHNPFPTDVYLLGNFIRDDFLQKTTKRPVLSFMDELVAKMTAADPDNRPRMSEVVAEFDAIVSKMKGNQLRSQVKLDADWHGHGVLGHLVRRIAFTLMRKRAIPHRARNLDILS